MIGFKLAVAAFVFVVLAGTGARAEEAAEDFSYFGTSQEISAYELDYSLWSFFLQRSVFQVGTPTRRYAMDREPPKGTRLRKGHTGRFRYECNRVSFSLMNRSSVEGISAYRKDLERVGNEIDYTKLSKNEQLAFWLNLHNVLVIEQIATRYPIGNIRDRQDELFDTKLVTIAGIPLSVNDIRYRIVYRYWDDPLVIYGFYHGVIGGPSIQPVAFNGRNVKSLLAFSAKDLANSMRGLTMIRGTLMVSRTYERAKQLFPDWPKDLISHLRDYARDDVLEIMPPPESAKVKATVYDWQIADLVNAQGLSPATDSLVGATGKMPAHGLTFIVDVYQRQEDFLRDRQPETRVIIIDEPLRDESDEEEDPEDETESGG